MVHSSQREAYAHFIISRRLKQTALRRTYALTRSARPRRDCTKSIETLVEIAFANAKYAHREPVKGRPGEELGVTANGRVA